MTERSSRRSRRATSKPSAKADDSGSWLKRGKQAQDTSHQEIEAAKQRQEQRKQGSAFRFFKPKGEEANIVVLDAKFEEIPFFYEHNLQTPEGKWSIFEPCVKEFAECAVCQGYGQRGDSPRPSYYAMFISIIDTSGFTKKDGEHVEFDRKLLVVKQGQHQEFFRIFETAMKQHGTIRGLELTMLREDTQNSSSIGKPVMQDDGTMYIMNSEDDLLADFGHDAITDDNGKVLMEADIMTKPYDYGKLFPKPDPDALRKRYGAPAVAGSAEDTKDEGWDDDAPTQAPSGGRRSRRSQSAKPAAKQAAEPAASTGSARRPRTRSSRNF